jgi:hypothetical protein
MIKIVTEVTCDHIGRGLRGPCGAQLRIDTKNSLVARSKAESLGWRGDSQRMFCPSHRNDPDKPWEVVR